MSRKTNSYNLDNPGFIDSESNKRNGSSTAHNFHASSLASPAGQQPHRLARSDCVCAALTTVTLLLILSCVAIGLILTGIISLGDKDQSKSNTTTCLSSTCVKISGRILRSMDSSTDPCQDFFQYACGGWVQENFIPARKINWTPLTEIKEEISMFYKGELAIGIGNDDPPAFQKFKELYEGCINTTHRNELGIEPVRPYIEMLGGMNYTGDWNSTGFDLTKSLSSITQYQTFILFEIQVKPNGFNKSINSLLLLPPMNRWGHSLRMKEDQLYEAFVQILGWYYQNDSFSLEEVKSVVNFTMDLLELIRSTGEKQSYSEAFSNKMSLADIQSVCTVVNWTRFMNYILPQQVDDSFELYVYNTTFFEELNTLISETETGVLNDFILTAFILDQLPYLSKDTKSLPSSLTPYIDGSHDMCLRISNMIMRTAGEALFIHKFFKGTVDTKDRIKEVVYFVRESFLRNIEELTWIDEMTKERIVEKALMMGMAISHAEILANLTAVEEMTPESVSRENFFESVLNATVQYSKILYSTINNIWENYYWREISIISQPNAFYHMSDNIFAILAGLIDEPFYSIGGPRYVNFGSLGTVIGHEITHGYDTKGRQYDAIGQMKDWWSNETTVAFDIRTQCFIDQFDNMTVYLEDENITIPISGELTLSENIADAGGIRASFRAYKSWRTKNGPEVLLPGMPAEMTWEKLFFLAVVQPFCQKSTKTYMEFVTKWDVHTPFMARVRGWVMNSEDFAKAYNCPSDSPMNPINKCRIW